MYVNSTYSFYVYKEKKNEQKRIIQASIFYNGIQLK